MAFATQLPASQPTPPAMAQPAATPRRTGKMRRSGTAATRPISSAPRSATTPRNYSSSRPWTTSSSSLRRARAKPLTAYLGAMARFHNYSFREHPANRQTAARRPRAWRAFGTWNEMGRFVKKGEKGIQILAPMIGYRRNGRMRRRAGDRRRKPQPVLIGFRAVYVFDVAQTEGADLPEFEHSITGEVGEHRDRLIDFLAQQNIALEFNEKIAPALGVSYGGKIALLPGQSKAEEFTTLVHETAHELLHKAERRTMTTADRARDRSRGRGLHRGPGRWLGDGQRFERLHPDVRGQRSASGRKP